MSKMEENGEYTPNDLEHPMSRDAALQRIRTSNTVMMSPELFEKLYLQPITNVKGDLRKTFGNPTPLGLMGFVISLTPIACCMMGWHGSGAYGAADIGVYYFIAGPCMLIAGVLEFFLGNTFPFLVFMLYGTAFLAFAASLQPFYNSTGLYSPTGSFAEGFEEPSFNASLAYFPICIAIISFFFMICATKTNAIFLLMFLGAGLGFALLAQACYEIADGNLATQHSYLVAAGAAWFATAMLGWYLLFIQLLGVMDFHVPLPVGDFSKFWAPVKRQAKEGEA